MIKRKKAFFFAFLLMLNSTGFNLKASFADTELDLAPASEMPLDFQEAIRQAKSQYDLKVFKRVDAQGKNKFVALIKLVGFEDTGSLAQFFSQQIPILNRDELLNLFPEEKISEAPEAKGKKGRLVFLSTFFSTLKNKWSEAYGLFAGSPIYHLGIQGILRSIIIEKIVGPQVLSRISQKAFINSVIGTEQFFKLSLNAVRAAHYAFLLKDLYSLLAGWLFPLKGDQAWYKTVFYFSHFSGTDPKKLDEMLVNLDKVLLQENGGERFGIYMHPSAFRETIQALQKSVDYQEVELPGF